jgi:DNA primase
MIAPADIDRARGRFDVIAAELPLRRQGRELAGCCPFHAEKTASFYVAPDKGFFHCFGCGAHGTAIDYLMRTRNLDFLEAVRELLDLPAQRPKAAPPTAPRLEPARDTSADIADILAGCGPVSDTTAAWLYLRLRGLIDPQHRRAPAALLAHPKLYCHETRRDMHAMVAPLTNSDGVVTAVQRFYLRPSVVVSGDNASSDNRADVKARKKTLGSMDDGAVQLAPPGTRLGLAEGVETALAAQRIFGMPVWAVCGTARFGYPRHWRESHPAPGERARVWIPPDHPPRDVDSHPVDERAPSVWIPASVEHLIVFGDRGLAGETCATHAARWYSRQGVPAEAVFPDEGFDDFNDELLGARR